MMTTNTVEFRNKIIAIMAMVLRTPVDSISDETSVKDAGNWDSLRHMNLIAVLEDEFEIEFGLDQISRMTTLSAILAEVNVCLTN